jgi:hypothetical protein
MKLDAQIHILKHDLKQGEVKAEYYPDFIYSIILLGDSITLINTGPEDAENLIYEYIAKQGRSADEIDTLILTHAKTEFIGAAPAIKSKTKCMVIAHYQESKRIEQLINIKVDYSIDGNEKFTFGKTLDVDLLHLPENPCGCLSVYFPYHKMYFSESFSTTNSGNANTGNNNELSYLYGKYNSIKEVEVLISPFSEPVTGRKNIRGFLNHAELPLSATQFTNQKFKNVG